MTDTNQVWIVEIEEDPETGDLYMPLPMELIESLGWKIGDTLVWGVNDEDQSVTLKKSETVTEVASSPERHTFQLNNYLKRCNEEGKDPNPELVAMYKSWQEEDKKILKDAEWRKNNLEWDLRTTPWMLDKVLDDCYAQNLYAALCNMQWQRIEVFPILKNEVWSCSWRSAGGIIADMQGKGDYINWYCSGIGEGLGNGDPDGTKGYVPEGTVTEEIREDLRLLGWQPIEWADEE